MNKPTTGPHTYKKYRCVRCGHELMIGTNHWGECYGFGRLNRCPECGWKHPMDADTFVCCESPPDDVGIPEPWRKTTLGEVMQ